MKHLKNQTNPKNNDSIILVLICQLILVFVCFLYLRSLFLNNNDHYWLRLNLVKFKYFCQ